MPYGLGRIQALGADIHTVLDTVTAKDTEGVIQIRQALLGCRIAAIGEESIRLQQPGWPDKPIGIPPERGTTG